MLQFISCVFTYFIVSYLRAEFPYTPLYYAYSSLFKVNNSTINNYNVWPQFAFKNKARIELHIRQRKLQFGMIQMRLSRSWIGSDVEVNWQRTLAPKVKWFLLRTGSKQFAALSLDESILLFFMGWWSNIGIQEVPSFSMWIQSKIAGKTHSSAKKCYEYF